MSAVVHTPLPWAVGTGSVVDPVDHHHMVVVEDLMDDAVVAASRCVGAHEVPDEGLADPSRVVSQRSVDELEHRGGLARRSAAEISDCAGGELDPVRHASRPLGNAEPFANLIL